MSSKFYVVTRSCVLLSVVSIVQLKPVIGINWTQWKKLNAYNTCTKFFASNPSQKVLKYTKTVNSIPRTFSFSFNIRIFIGFPHPVPIPLPPCVVFLIVVDQEAKNHFQLWTLKSYILCKSKKLGCLTLIFIIVLS